MNKNVILRTSNFSAIFHHISTKFAPKSKISSKILIFLHPKFKNFVLDTPTTATTTNDGDGAPQEEVSATVDAGSTEEHPPVGGNGNMVGDAATGQELEEMAALAAELVAEMFPPTLQRAVEENLN